MTPATLLPDLPPTPPSAPGSAFKAELIGMLRDHSASKPRTKQAALGPSEIGHPCDRKLAYGLVREPRCNTAGDTLPALVGTAAHTEMEALLRDHNARCGPRWLIEQRVYPAPGFGGSMDAYDMRDAAVLDWKFPGATTMTKVRKDRDPGVIYRTQAHLYGLGAENMGLSPKLVRIVFLPRAGFSTGAFVWEAPYDRTIAQAALDRMWATMTMAYDLRVEDHPDRYSLFPVTPHMCEYCPFYAARPTGPYQCDGEP